MTKELTKSIGSMLMFGFPGTNVQDKTIQQFLSYTREGLIGNTILFRRNIKNPDQIKSLTTAFFKADPSHIIAVDQEGGKVERLTDKTGFQSTESAKFIATQYSEDEAEAIYLNMAKMLKENGINMNLGPVVDLDNKIAPCPAIGTLQRSYSDNSDEVVKYASSFIKAHRKAGVLTSLKHFPGHGHAIGDTHHGMVDATKTWNDVELTPFAELIRKKLVDSIMTAHIINRNIDDKYPSTLSQKVLNDMLRKDLNYSGVVITDDMQMGAIQEEYNLKESVINAIKAGCDILIFSNNNPMSKGVIDAQTGQNTEILTPEVIIDIILEALKNGDINADRILESEERIIQMKNQLNNAINLFHKDTFEDFHKEL